MRARGPEGQGSQAQLAQGEPRQREQGEQKPSREEGWGQRTVCG